MKTEINATIQDVDAEAPTKAMSSFRGQKAQKYDGTTALPDQKQEDYIHRIIYHLGNRKKAFEEIYYPQIENPNYQPSMPYRFFERKGFQKRYNYLMKQAMFSAGIDHRTLLMKAATLVDNAIAKKNVRDFATMVDTILKLEAPMTARREEWVEKKPKTTQADLAPIKELLEELKG